MDLTEKELQKIFDLLQSKLKVELDDAAIDRIAENLRSKLDAQPLQEVSDIKQSVGTGLDGKVNGLVTSVNSIGGNVVSMISIVNKIDLDVLPILETIKSEVEKIEANQTLEKINKIYPKFAARTFYEVFFDFLKAKGFITLLGVSFSLWIFFQAASGKINPANGNELIAATSLISVALMVIFYAVSQKK